MYSTDLFQANRLQVIDDGAIIGFIQEQGDFFIAHHQDGQEKPCNSLQQAKDWFEKPVTTNQIEIILQ